MSTPAGRSSRISESTVLGEGSRISIILLWVHISKCSRESLFTCGDLITQYKLRAVGNGIGPEMVAPVLSTVSTIYLAD